MTCRIPILSKLTVTYNLTYIIQQASFDTLAPAPSVVSGCNSSSLLLSNASWCGWQAWFYTRLNLIHTGTVLWTRDNTASNGVVPNHIRHLRWFTQRLTLLLLKTLSCPFLTWISRIRFVVQCFCALFNNLPWIETSKQENGRINLNFLFR